MKQMRAIFRDGEPPITFRADCVDYDARGARVEVVRAGSDILANRMDIN